ncbi:hypothetical protein [Phormidesmis sp. 146-33]
MSNLSQISSSQVYSTAEVADKLGVSESTLRSRKSRDGETLLEGCHWLNSEGKTLWTIVGLLKLAESFDTPEAKAFRESATLTVAKEATPIVSSPATPTVPNAATENGHGSAAIGVSPNWLEPLLDATGREMFLLIG